MNDQAGFVTSAFRGALNPGAAAEVAAAHQQAPVVGDAFAYAAYRQLIAESDQLFRRITSGPDHVRVGFTMCQAPYSGADELIASIGGGRLLEVVSSARDRGRRHPLMGCEIGGAYDRFRAVHDVLGHGCLRVGFDRDGEFAAWRHQERLHSPLARHALATELHAEHSFQWTTGDPPDHKAVILDERLVERSRRGLP